MFRTVTIGLLLIQLIGFTKEIKKSQPAIKVGFLGTFSGPNSANSKKALRSLQLALEEQNAVGGIGGRLFQVFAYDTGNSPIQILRLVPQWKKDGVILLTGVLSSNEAAVVAKLSDQNKLPTIITSSTYSKLTRDHRYLIRLCINAEQEAYHLTRFARGRLQARHVVQVVDVSENYSNAMAELFKRKFEGDGGTILQTYSVRKGERDFANVISELVAMKRKPDLIFSVAGAIESGSLMSALASAQLQIPVLGNTMWESAPLAPKEAIAFFPTLWANAGRDKKSALFFEAFQKRYKETIAKTNASAGLSYDAGLFIVEALKNASSVEPQLLLRAMKNTKINGITGEILIRDGKDPEKNIKFLGLKNGRLDSGVAE